MSAPGTGNFTYEFWFNNTATSAGNQTLMNSRQSVGVGQQKDGFDVAITSTRSMYASYKSLAFFNTGDGTIDINRWYHFALVRIGNTTYGYLDGNLIASQALAGDGLNLYSQRLWIGTTANLSNKFTGHISNYRYTKNNLYSSNFSPPTDDYDSVANTSILLKTKNDTTFITNSISGTTFINNGGATASSQNPFESNSTQASRDAAADAERRRAQEERATAVKIAREKLTTLLVNKQPISTQDITAADLPIVSVDSLALAYQEMIAVPKRETANASDVTPFELNMKTIMKYAIYERITGVNTGKVFGRDLALYDIVPVDAPMKELTTYQLLSRANDERDTITKVDSLLKKSSLFFKARKDRLAATIARIQSR